LALQAAFAMPAAAAGDHAFDANLSLTGGMGASSLDPAPDPGPDHPPQPFAHPCGVAVDPAGDVYVASQGEEVGGVIKKGRIDVFDASGRFLEEIPNEYEPCEVAVDAAGNVYVVQRSTLQQALVRYAPDSYPPSTSTSYGSPTVVDPVFGIEGLAVDQVTGHVFAAHPSSVAEYSSAEEGNALLRSDIGEGTLDRAHGIAVDSKTGNIFVSSICPGCDPTESGVSLVYVFDSSGVLTTTIDGEDLPEGDGFTSPFGDLYLAVNEESGELFVTDAFGKNKRAYRFLPEGATYVYDKDPELEEHGYVWPLRIAVANGAASPTQGNVYVTSSGTPGHLYAFVAAGEVAPPAVSAVTVEDVGSIDARFVAQINPGGAATTYLFLYVSAEQFREDEEVLGPGHGFDHALSTQPSQLAAGNQAVAVSVPVTGLTPGTTYKVRLIADNHCVSLDPEQLCTVKSSVATFATYPGAPLPQCPNEALRTGASASLPDCRAYELVTPPDTNGRAPTAVPLSFAFDSFATELASPDGTSLLFMTEGGSLPGLGGNGIADGYEATRSGSGWGTRLAGPTGGQTQAPGAGGASSDHGYWFWETGQATDHGTLVVNSQSTHYVRLPDGSFRLIGTGLTATDPRAIGRWISPGGSHLIFSSTKPLVDGASPQGTLGIYDTRSDGTTHLVSVKPSGSAPAAGAVVEYLGTSADGTTVAFAVSEGGVTTLYVHRADSPTAVVSTGSFEFAGLAANGTLLTYVKGGDIFSFDVASETSTPVGSGGESVPVNVSADGTHVYFVSRKVLVPDPGPGAGKQNFYVWDANSGAIAYIGRLTAEDVEGTASTGGLIFGLGQWTQRIGPSQNVVYDPSRTIPDGRAIVFESHANLAGYNPSGHSEVYRYARDEQPQLLCLSCNPTLSAASGDAHLQIPALVDPLAVIAGRTPAHNVSDDGGKAFFQSSEPLVATDVDGKQDVYEWEAQGVGGCQRLDGCVSLISSAHSSEPEYLYAATPSGNDVFVASADLLAYPDQDTTYSIYDARVNGGFSGQGTPPCDGDSCRAVSTPTPFFQSPATQGESGRDNVQRRPCRRGFKKLRRHGRVRCVRRHRHERHRQKGQHRRGSARG
jgi:hypothetical protein